MPRPSVPTTQAFRRVFADRFMYILYFQDEGPADAELDRDPATTFRRLFALTTSGQRRPDQVRFERGDWLVFGSETDGLPADILAEFAPRQRLRLPMRPHNRSLNLSNAVAVTVFEAWRQFDFEGMAPF